MTVEFKTSFDKTQFKRVQELFAKTVAKDLREEILDLISKGKSPVKSGRWDRPYSKSYIKQINAGYFKRFAKKTSPVNLELSGQMLDGLIVKKDGNKIICTFDDDLRKGDDNGSGITNADLADIHNRQGAGKSRAIRQILPTKPKQEFSRTIQLLFDDILRESIRKVLK